MSKILLKGGIVLILILSFANCFDKEKLIKKYKDKLTKENVYEKFGVKQSKFEKFLSFSKTVKEDYNNCETRKDFDLPDVFMFMPILKGKLFKPGDKIEFGNHCFANNVAEFVGYNDGLIRISITSSEAFAPLCMDNFIFHTASILEYREVFFSGKNDIDIVVSEDQYKEIQVQGLRIFALCEDLVSTVESIIATIEFFFGGDWLKSKESLKAPLNAPDNVSDEERERLAVEFYEKFVQVTPIKREGYEKVALDVEQYIKSGDLIGENTFTSGVAMGITYITGPPMAHSAIALRIDGKLHVVESAADGILMHTWEEFINRYMEREANILWFSLSEENSKKFNTEKAYEWVKDRIGLEYGYRTFIAAPVDKTKDTLPPYMSVEILMFFFNVVELFGDKSISQINLADAINARLGTQGLDLQQLSMELTKQGKVFEDMVALPELENYQYPNGENWICSAIVAKIYMEAGVIQADVLPKEFVPRDLPQMQLFDPDFKNNRPDVCKEADPDVDFCQIAGKYRLPLNGYNSVPIYDHMNENCPFVPPAYERPEGC